MKVLVTGANGFIGKNLVLRLRENVNIEVLTFVRGQSMLDLTHLLVQADAVVHLAGENRPSDIEAFAKVNAGLTKFICKELKSLCKTVPVLLASSTQVELGNPYGLSKFEAEEALRELADVNGNPVAIYRLPGVFGKWCKPNYNSVVATFCYNRAHDLPIYISDISARVRLVYIEDVIDGFLNQLTCRWVGLTRPTICCEYSITLGELSDQIEAFKNSRRNLLSERVGQGLIRALYATYLSYLPVHKFAYQIPVHKDVRGLFVEMLKTPDTGQFSFFTAHPGITRGGHYHHTKTEKFLVIKGRARFGFRHMLSNEVYYIESDGDHPQIVETVPGWTHDITNIGQDEIVVMLWANEIYDKANPDTIASKV